MPSGYREIRFRDERGNPTEPLPAQAKFLKSKAKYTLYAGAFRAGKTHCLCIDAITTALEYPGSTVVLSRKNYPELHRTTMRTFFDVLGITEDTWRSSPWIKYYNIQKHEGHFVNGSRFDFIAIDDRDKIKSTWGGWWGFDEVTEFTYEDFLLVLSRLSSTLGPMYWRGATNPEGHDWVYDFFHPDSPTRNEYAEFYHTSSRDNTYLDPEYVKTLYDTYPEHWVRRYLEGSFDVFEGQIYPEFDREKHVKDFDYDEFPKEWIRFAALDWGFQNPCAANKFCIDYDNNLYVFGNHYEKELSVAQHVEILKPWQAAGFRPFLGGHDLKQQIRRDWEGLSLQQEFRKCGLYIDIVKSDVRAAISAIKTRMKAGTIFIHPEAQWLLWELPKYKWKPPTTISAAIQNAPEEPMKKDDHAMEVLRYAANWIDRKARKPLVVTETDKHYFKVLREEYKKGRQVNIADKDFLKKYRKHYAGEQVQAWL